MDTSFHVIPVRICEYCGDREKEAFPYGAHDTNGKYWDVLCNDCYDLLGCNDPQGEQTCETCGGPLEWADCWNGCDDGFIDRYEEDPLWYDEDDTEPCHVCRGAGGWWVCPNASTHKEDSENS